MTSARLSTKDNIATWTSARRSLLAVRATADSQQPVCGGWHNSAWEEAEPLAGAGCASCVGSNIWALPHEAEEINVQCSLHLCSMQLFLLRGQPEAKPWRDKPACGGCCGGEDKAW